MQTDKLSRLMYMSWEIQRKKKYSRSRSLYSAWAIYLNEDIAVFHLVRKHNPARNGIQMNLNNLSLF
jgi:hypothetical protein